MFKNGSTVDQNFSKRIQNIDNVIFFIENAIF